MRHQKLERARATAPELALQTQAPVRLRLYVAGATNRSQQAIIAIRQRLAVDEAHSTLQVVDVYQQPELARQDRVVVTPTLIRLDLLPPLRCVGAALIACRLAHVLSASSSDDSHPRDEA